MAIPRGWRGWRGALSLVVAVGATACASAGSRVAEAERPMALFLLAGQSNMAGRGVVEPADRVPHPRIWMLDAERQWVPAVEPLHFDKPVAGVGPGLAFARVLVERDPELVVGLVPTAVGGSPISTWRPGEVHDQTGTPPFDDAIARARAAGPRGRWAGILWHQGESDANPDRAPRYEGEMRSLIERLRRELGDPGLPFIIGQLGEWEERPWTEHHRRVDEVHRRMAIAIPGVAYVSSAGLGHKGDSLHFSAAGARELGRRYAEAYLGMR